MAESTLLDRVSALERENRRLRIGLVGVATLAGVFGLFGQARASREAVVEAQRFVVKDGEGRERVVLGLEPDGSGHLTFLRADGSRGNSFSDRVVVVPTAH